ncbi:hypothetical protein [Mucilaginibacter sp.]|uniref:hypothetical protein n=1 Tax=Mucilaginibacter sp. TaxID=1882438 RepID=UPI003D100D7C
METTQILTGKEGEDFDLELAASWTQNYRHKHPGETQSHFFGKEILQKILDQEGCMGIRFYHAHSKPLSSWQRSMVSLSKFLLNVVGNVEGEKHIIIAGATRDGSDMLNTKTAPQPLGRTELKAVALMPLDIVGQQSMPCPGSPGCPKNLMSVSKSEL